MHAVVVDPSRVVLKLVGDLIAERGDVVSEFMDSASALRAIREDPTVDVLITSMEVQPMAGLELCWEARMAVTAQRPLYIIVMSSLSDDERLAEALDCGADDLIAKPVRRLELHARLRMAGRLKQAQLHLVRLAETDPLTGLLNRRAFFERLSSALANRKPKNPLTAVLFDIDHFKRINDNFGHDVGDLVLRRISEEAATRSELCGRLGGEEFAYIAEGNDLDKVARLADSLRRACANIPFSAEGQKFNVTCSFGISPWAQGDIADNLLKRADIALYQAKESGRNRVQVYGQAINMVFEEGDDADFPDRVTRKRRRAAPASRS
jgi:diguanylate cyclase (GGDEF)-like protein